jgi:hypothetical protein
VAAGFGNDVLRANGVKFVRLGNLVFQGATGSPMIHIYGSENVELDHVTIYGGFPELLINASQHIRVTNSAFRGLAAPWTSRAHMKYRGTASYQIVLKNNQPLNENIEFSNCEFTDDHDFAFLRYVKGLHFHHNFVDNFNDDGLECGPKLRDHTLFISQNRIGRCLIPLSQHEIDKDESPVDHDPQAGNVIDLRGGTYKSPPGQEDPSGEFLHTEGHLMGDHGSPVWPVLHFYQNTVLRDTPTFRDSFLFGLGSQGLRRTERDIFNNIFVQSKGAPGTGFIGMQHAENVREGGNLIWSVQDGPALNRDVFAKFRASKLFDESRQHYEAGWTTHDRVADPKFMRFPAERPGKTDLILSPDSPALASGQPIASEWPDPLRNTAQPKPDIGALPAHAAPWGVGIDGRIPLMVGE